MRIAPLISATVRGSPPKCFSKHLVRFGDGLEEDLAVLPGDLVGHVGRDLLDVVLGAHGDITLGVARPDQRAHLDEVDDADEVVLDADGQLEHERLGLELVDDRVDREVEVGAELVHLVDEADAGTSYLSA